MKATISIVMPVYNTEHCLRESIESILKQTFSDFELIIVDDGSTDKSILILKSFCDDRIVWISNKHDFIDSLNKGINKSKGKYIVRMDADDVMLPCRLETQYNFLEKHKNIDICGSWAEMFGERLGIIQRPIDHSVIVHSMLLANPLIHPTVMMKRSIIQYTKKTYKYNYPYAEDYKLWTDFALRGIIFANIPDVLLKYRISQKQVTHLKKNEMISSSLKVRIEYAEKILKKMGREKELFIDLFNDLVELYNKDIIDVETFLHAVYPLSNSFFISK
jgi:glycosyltransferase involved in cell wall biosynthesis